MNQVTWAVGYCRLSDRGSNGAEVSLQRQEQQIRAYAAANGFELIEIFTDAGVSGRRSSRRGLNSAISEAALRRCTLISYSLDRIARDRRVLDRLTRERITFRCIDAPGVNESQLAMMLFLAEQYSASVSAKMKNYHESRKQRAARGECLPHPVPSYRPDGESARQTVAIARSVASNNASVFGGYAWTRIKPCLDSGMSYRETARVLNEAGYRSARGKSWSHVMIMRIAKSRGHVSERSTQNT